MSIIKKTVGKVIGKALRTAGLKFPSGYSSSPLLGFSSRNLSKLTTNTAMNHNGIRSTHSRILGLEPWL